MFKKASVFLAVLLSVFVLVSPAHTTISSDTFYISYNGDGATSEYEFTFKAWADSHITVVKKNSTTNAEETLTLDSDYTVTRNSDQESDPGGSITLIGTETPSASGYTYWLIANVPNTQTTDYTEGSSFPIESVETSLDKLTMQAIQSKNASDRALKLSVANSSGVDTELPAPQGGYYFRWNNAGTGIENAPTEYPSATSLDIAHISTYSNNLGTAVTTIGSSVKTLIIDVETTVNTDVTVPATLNLWIVKGGTLNVSLSKTLTINGPLNAGIYQIFSGSGTVSFGAGYVNELFPQWWGAVGDGSTDDSSAVQSAITAASGKTVKFTNGNFLIDSTRLYVRNSNVTLLGDGVATLTWSNSPSGTGNTARGMILVADASDPDTAMSNFTMKGLRLDGGESIASSYTQYKEALVTQTISEVRVEDNYFTGFPAEVIVFNSPTQTFKGVHVINNEFTDCAGNESISVQGTQNSGIFIIGNYIHDTAMGINGGSNSGTVISNNVIRDCTGFSSKPGIAIGAEATGAGTEAYPNITVEGNSISNVTGAGILVYSSVYASSIKNNVIRKSSQDATASQRAGIMINDAFKLNVSGNIITETGDGTNNAAGIQCVTGQFISITENLVTPGASGSQVYGILASSERNMVECHNNMVFGHTSKDYDGATTNEFIKFNSIPDTNIQTNNKPTKGTYHDGERVWKVNAIAGNSPGWICTTAGTFSSATDATGDTDGSTAVITGMTDTSDFYVGQYVTVSAGFPSASTPYQILAKTSTTVTLNTNSTSVQSNVTVATPDPVFTEMECLAPVQIRQLANDATPSISAGSGNHQVWQTGGTTTITDIDDGVQGLILTIIAMHSVTITDGTNILLNGSANFAMNSSDTLTLVLRSDNIWYEIGRSDNT